MRRPVSGSVWSVVDEDTVGGPATLFCGGEELLKAGTLSTGATDCMVGIDVLLIRQTDGIT